MKLYIGILAVALITATMISCSSDSYDDSENYPTPTTYTTFRATLNQAGEVPPTGSMATGNATLTFNNTTKIFTIQVTYSAGLVVTDGHVHKGAVGVSGPAVFAFTSFTSPINYTSPTLDATQEADLKANLYYVNLHTVDFPLGEIRGQLIKQTSGGGGY
jgi:CHRD domain-containing protein